ncbi:P4HTM [Symbiodinium natans]|uniref:P4HTM protein n=1 Tax=Symbiodinium natans TaxID=878477 RepID=A0A812KD65_9DINO|nr:P4HTM [Symbiodinium natans]
MVDKEPVTKKLAKRIFAAVDANRDGALDRLELAEFLREAADMVDVNYTAFLADQLGSPKAAEEAAAGRKEPLQILCKLGQDGVFVENFVEGEAGGLLSYRSVC